jgi:hypothetical protein
MDGLHKQHAFTPADCLCGDTLAAFATIGIVNKYDNRKHKDNNTRNKDYNTRYEDCNIMDEDNNMIHKMVDNEFCSTT